MTTVPITYWGRITNQQNFDKHKSTITHILKMYPEHTDLAIERCVENITDEESAFHALHLLRVIMLEQFAVGTTVFYYALHEYCQILLHIELRFFDVDLRDAVRVGVIYYLKTVGLRTHEEGLTVAFMREHLRALTRKRRDVNQSGTESALLIGSFLIDVADGE